jgi:hypothetical protein
LQISLSDRMPHNLRPGAFGYSLPFEGTHIVIFLDPIRANVREDLTAALLAHVIRLHLAVILDNERVFDQPGTDQNHY